jgi:photosystem II stability/assembly factor-like uncharacterized protein
MPHDRRRLLPFLPLLLAALVPRPAAAGLDRWTTAGPFGGRVFGLAVAADPAGTVFAETGNGIFRSADAGRSWTRAPLPVAAAFTVAVHARRPRTVWALSPDAGLFRSLDRGATFTPVSAPERLQRLYPATAAPQRLYATDFDGLWRSLDGGASWFRTLLEGHVRAVAFHPSDPDLVYAATLLRLFRSRDGGVTWTRIGAGFPFGVHTLLVDPRQPKVLYAAFDGLGSGGLFKSRDGGASWAPAMKGMGEGLDKVVPALDPSNPATLYAGVLRRSGHGQVGELFRSRDGGASWKRLRFTEVVLALAVDPLRPARLYAGLEVSGVLRSADGGGVWRPSDHGLRASFVSAAAVDPFTPGRLLAAHGGLSESRDRGLTWTRLSDELRRATFRIYTIVFAPWRPDEIYVGSHGGVHKSVDGGATWEAAGEGLDGHVIERLAAHPVVPDFLLAAGWIDLPDPEGRHHEYALFRSADGAASWARLDLPIPGVAVLDFAFDVGEPETIHALTSETVYTSLDAGATWARPTSAPPQLEDLEGDPHQPGALYALRPSIDGVGVLASQDRARTWSPLGTPHPFFEWARTLALTSTLPRTFFVASLGEVHASDDEGATWTPLGGTLFPFSASALLLDPGRPRDVYAVTRSGGGLFLLTRP